MLHKYGEEASGFSGAFYRLTNQMPECIGNFIFHPSLGAKNVMRDSPAN
jgi:hypothetical protein